MGDDRGKCKNKESEEIQQSLMKEFKLNENDLFSTWLCYVYNIASGVGQLNTIDILKNNENVKIKTLDYFTALGLSMITNSMEDKI